MSTTNTIAQVDVRGPRFAAWVTTVVLVITLVISGFSTPAAEVVLALQAVVFGIGALGGPRRHPYGLVFRAVVAPRMGRVVAREPVPPLKFAQLLGFVFAVVGVAGFAAGIPLLGVIATAAALAAAFLNAAFGICLGCQLYPLVARLPHIRAATMRVVKRRELGAPPVAQQRGGEPGNQVKLGHDGGRDGPTRSRALAP